MKKDSSPQNQLTKSIKIKVAATTLWALISFLISLGTGEHTSEIIVIFLMLTLPFLTYWLGFWIWGNGYLFKVISAPFKWLFKPNPKFNRDDIEAEHPWRRWFARNLDYILWSFVFGFVLGMLKPLVAIPNIDFDNKFVWALIVLATWIPIEAIFLRLWQATPGKWVLGIYVETKDSQKSLTFLTALKRSLGVYVAGMAIGIPLLNLFTLSSAYERLSKGKETGWDEQYKTRTRYHDIRWWLLLILLGVLAGLSYMGIRNQNIERNIDAFVARVQVFPQQRTDAINSFLTEAGSIIEKNFAVSNFNCAADLNVCNENLKHSKAMLDKMKSDIESSYTSTEDELAILDVPQTYKDTFTKSYMPAKMQWLKKFNEFYEVEAKALDTYRGVVAMLFLESDEYTFVNGKILFKSDAVQAQFLERLNDIQALAKQETSILKELSSQ
jgi:uncharacterized RDD family membrane protein YckC